VTRADVLILGAPHKQYRELKIPLEKMVIDIWNYWPERRKSFEDALARVSGEGKY
jgi:hypothetical protein